MKRIFYTLAAMVLFVTQTFAQTSSLNTTFATEDEFKLWTVVDANEDEKTWQFNIEATDGHVFYEYHGTNKGNDYLISPEITPDKDGYIIIRYAFKGSSYGEILNIYTGTGTDVSAYTQEKSHTAVAQVYNGAIAKAVKKGEPFRIAFQAASEPNKWRLYLQEVKTEYTDDLSKQVDLQVTELTSPVSAEGLTAEETVKVKITNNGLAASKAYAVTLEVDGKAVATEQVTEPVEVGDTTEYAFTAKADLSTIGKIYSIRAYTVYTDDTNHANDTITASVRHKGPASVPYSNGFELTDNLEDITYFNLNNDDGNWEVVFNDFFVSMARTGSGCLGYNYNKVNDGDDWAILEPINVEEGYYVLRFYYAASENHPERLGVYYGSEPKPEAMTNEIVKYDPAENPYYMESVNIIHFDKAQKIYIGFHAFSDKDENWLTIDDVTFEKASSESVDMILLSMPEPYDFVRENNSKSISVVLKNAGILDADVTVRAYINDEKADTFNLTMEAQKVKNIAFSNILEDLTPGKHEVKVEIVCDKDENHANDTLRRSITVLDKPVAIYGFEGNVISKFFTMHVNDTATIHPDAGEEYNDMGWGLFPITDHPMLGKKVLAGCTWFEEDNITADRWFVLPKMKIDTVGEAYFVWDAFSYNPKFLEDYQIRVSDNGDTAKWYTTELTVKGETSTPKTRGLNLSDDYAGKEIFVAIRVNTDGGEALLLDNLGLYGSISGEFPEEEKETGVENIKDDINNIYIYDDIITTDDANATITLYTVNGQLISTTRGQANITSLSQGIYVATIKTEKGVSTHKIIK